jgi:hypothetical protein
MDSKSGSNELQKEVEPHVVSPLDSLTFFRWRKDCLPYVIDT